MKKIIIFNLLFIFTLSCLSQNKTKIDQTKGFHKYKFGMILEECDCSKEELNIYKECIKYPENLNVGKIKVIKIGLNFEQKKLKVLYVYVGYTHEKLWDTENILIKKYGEPVINYKYDVSKSEYTEIIEGYSWNGDSVRISLQIGKREYGYYGKFTSSHYITYYYRGKKENTEF